MKETEKVKGNRSYYGAGDDRTKKIELHRKAELLFINPFRVDVAARGETPNDRTTASALNWELLRASRPLGQNF